MLDIVELFSNCFIIYYVCCLINLNLNKMSDNTSKMLTNFSDRNLLEMILINQAKIQYHLSKISEYYEDEETNIELGLTNTAEWQELISKNGFSYPEGANQCHPDLNK